MGMYTIGDRSSERVDTMFTLEQINEIHDRLGRAESLAQYVKALNALGVETYDSYIMDGHSEYVEGRISTGLSCHEWQDEGVK
jgi:hypothetical protein